MPCLSTVLLLILPVSAADKQKDEDTFRQANLVLQGLIDSRDISHNVLSKALCVLILPNVKKFGFGVGGSGGRGPLLCRSGQDFKGNGPPLRCIQSAGPALVCRSVARPLTSCSCS